ncbi:CDP-diacylglycerol--glycerol-3-phosphate 3-phosphatidyltransferase, partial [hydrothermal vent metagenome]
MEPLAQARGRPRPTPRLREGLHIGHLIYHLPPRSPTHPHPIPSAVPDSPPPPNRPTWLPNALVWLRLVLAAVFVGLLAGNPLDSPGILLAATGIFILAALTDMLDGKLARAWDCVSRFGRIMDSFADKILVLGAFVCLAGPTFAVTSIVDGQPTHFQSSGVYPWMVVLILGRELLITSLRGLIEGEGGDFSAIWAGKWKMVAQSVAVPVILLVLALAPWQPGNMGR